MPSPNFAVYGTGNVRQADGTEINLPESGTALDFLGVMGRISIHPTNEPSWLIH